MTPGGSPADERGIINTYTYAAGIFGAVSTQVPNYQSGVTASGVNVQTDFTYDSQGRLNTTLGPSHTVVISGSATSVQPVTWIIHNQSAQPTSGTWAPDQTLTGTGYTTGTLSTDFTLVNPVSITNTDKDGRTTDQITSVRTTGTNALSPTDTFAQTDWQSWSSTQFDNQHRTISGRAYFAIPTPDARTGDR